MNAPTWLPHPDLPYGDWLAALEKAECKWVFDEGGGPHAAVGPEDIDRVIDWHVSYHSVPWKPGDEGTELSLIAVMRLCNGHHAALTAWNDYTGWDCQDGSEIRVALTYQGVWQQGLSDEDRRLLRGGSIG